MNTKKLLVNVLIKATVPSTGDRVSDCLAAISAAGATLEQPAPALLRAPAKSGVSILSAEEVDPDPKELDAVSWDQPAVWRPAPPLPTLAEVVAAIPTRLAASQHSQSRATGDSELVAAQRALQSAAIEKFRKERRAADSRDDRSPFDEDNIEQICRWLEEQL